MDFSIMKIRSLGIMLLIVLSSFVSFSQLDATFSSPDATQCPENLFTLNATNTTYGNSNYTWLITGPSSFSQTYSGSSVAVYLTVSGLYTVKLTVTDGVTSTTNTQNNFIQVYTKPTISYSVTPTTGCAPLVVSFNGTCTPGSGTLGSFAANAGDGTAYATEDFSHTFTSGGSFTPSVTVTNSFGCNITGNLTPVTVTASPSLTSPLNPNSICSGSTFNYTPTSTIAGTTYSWVRTLPSGVTASGSSTSTGTTGVISQTLTSATTQQVTYAMTVTANGCSRTQNVVVTVRALPTVSITQGATLAICTSQTGTLTAAGLPSGGTYLWSTAATTASINVTTAGARSVTYSDGTCSSAAATSTVSITTPPTISGFTRTETSGTTPNDGSICPGASATISATVSATGGTYLWSTGATTSTISVTPPITSAYTLTYTLGCATNNSTQITVLGLPTPSFTPLTSNFCAPPITTTFTNTSTNAAGGVVWSFSSGNGTPSSSTSSTPSVTYNQSGSWSVSLTATSAAGCSKTTVFQNAINIGSGAPPTSLFTATTPLTQCYSSIAAPSNAVANNSVCFQYTGSGADTIQWNWGDGSLSDNRDEVGTSCHTYEAVGTYSVVATPYTTVGSQLGCQGTPISFTVVINGPKADYSVSTIDCDNQRTRTFTSTSTGTTASATYVWDFGDTGSGVNNTSSLQTVAHTFTQTQTAGYSVKLTVTDASTGCPASAITTSVFAYPNNTAAFQSYNNTSATRAVTTEVCINGSLSFYNETPSPQLATQAAHTVWNINNTNATWSTVTAVRGNPNTYSFLETGATSNFDISWVPGTYSVSMRNRRDNPVNNQCLQILTKTNYIKVHGITGTFTVADTVCANASMSVNSSSMSAPVTSIASRVWDWGDGTANTTGNVVSPTHTYTNAGTYTIKLTATDQFGCSKILTKQVIVRKPLASFSVDRNFICPGQTVTVTNNSSGLGLTSYAWAAPTATPATATGISPAPFTFATAGSRTIKLTVTDNLGCIKDSTIAITVQNPVPSATASPSAVSCFNPPTSVVFTNTSTNNVDNTTAVWNFNATPSVAGNGVSPTTSTNWEPSATYSLPGTYIVTLQVGSLTGCTSAVTQVATVTIGGPSGTVNVTNTNLTGCSCYTANMTVTTANVTEARLLYGDGQFLVLTPNTTQTVSYSYCNTGSTTITRTPSLYISNGTCNGFISATQTINIKPTPTVNAISNQLKCAGVNSDAVTFTGNVPGATYTWSRTNTNISASTLALSGTGDIPSFITDNTTLTSVSSVFTVTPTYDGCTGSPTNFTITVGPRPVSTVSTTSVCVGGTVTTNPSTGGTWTSTITSAASITTSGIVSVGTPSTTLTTILRYTETTSGCFRDHSLTVNPKPTVTAASSVCIGSTINLSPSTLGTWVSSNTAVATIVSGTGVVTGVSSGAANFTYTITATGCTNTTSNVTVNSLPVVTLSPTTICQGEGATSTPITGGTWAVVAGTGVSITNGGVITTTTSATGPATFEFTQTSTACKATTGSLTINPLPTLTAPTSVCMGSTGALTPTSLGTWTSSNTAVATVTNAGVITPVSAGTVTFTYILTATGCSKTTSSVTINSLPTVTSGSSVCIGSTMSPSLTPNSGGTWTSSNTSRATVVAATGVVTGVSAGTVTFTYTQTSTGCSRTTSNVTVNALPTVTAASTSICIGGTTNLTPITGGTWASGTTAVASVDNAGLVTGLTAGTSIMTFTNSTTGCSKATSAITVNALPTFGTTKTDPTVCNATNGTVTLTGLTASTSYRYTYVLNGNTTGPTTVTSSPTGQIVVSNLGAGTYTFTVTLVSSSCTSAPQNISLVNPNAPDINDIADQLLCGTTYTLPTITGTNLPGNQVYSSQPGGFGTVYPVGTVISSTTTIYIWTRTPTTGGCSDQESFTVTINSNPVVTAPTSVCVGGTGPLTPTTGVTWTSSNTSIATVTSGGVITGVAAGSVTFTCVDNTTTCSTITPTVTIVAKPTLSAASFVCVNGTINITPATSGTWSSSDNTMATVTSAGLVTGKVPGTVQFTFTSTTTGCSNTTSDVTVRPQPILTSPASVCMGSTGLLSPTSGGTWTSLAIGTATVTNVGVITPVAPGNVTFRFLETSSGCSDTTSNVIINALPVLGGSTQVCVGANINLTPSTGGIWSGGSGGNSIATISPSGVVNGGSVGTTTFVFTSTATGCSKTSSTITVNPIPTVAGPSQVCVGSTTVNFTGGTGFTWSSNNTTIATVNQNTGIVTGVAAGTTYLINTNPFTGCFANSQPITVNALPVVTAPASVCVGSTVPLSPTTGGTWVSSDISKATVSSAGVVEGVAAGSLTFTFTEALTGCSKTTTSLTVIANPIITLSRTNPTVCNGTDGTIRISGLTANTSFQYSYTGPTSAGPITATTNASGQITISGLGAGTYTVTATNPVTTCKSAEVIITLTNPNSPNVTVIADQTLCGTTYTLPAITGSNLTNAQYWTATGGTGTVLPVGTVISTIGTTSVCMYSATPGGCSDEECFTVTINPLPVVSVPANVCQGQTVTATPTTGGSWAVFSGPTFVSVDNTGLVTGLLPGTSILRFTDATTNCSSNTTSITVKAVQTVDAGPAQTVCSNSPVTLAGTRGGSATASVWSGGTGFSSTSSLTPTYTLGLGDVGTVSLTLTAVDPTGICPDVSDQVIITIDQAPVVSAGLGQTICSNSTVTLGGTLGGVASNPTWSVTGGGTAGPFDNVNSLNAIYTPSSANITSGFVTLTLTTSDPAGPCTAVSSNVSITINPAATVSAGSDFVSCKGSPIQLTGVIGGSATSATWSGGNGTYSPDANTLTGTYMPTDQEFIDNTVTLTLTTNDPVGPCPDVNINVTITFANPATSTVSPDLTICEGESVNVSGSFGGAASSASWVYVIENSSTPGIILPNANSAAISYQPSASDITNGRARLIYRTNNPAGPCNAVDDTLTITINRTPFLLNNNTAIGCTGNPINLQLVVGGGLSADFSWFANNNPNVTGESSGVQTTSLISDVLTLNSGITTNQTVLYTVTPTILASGCVGTPLQISLTVVPRPTISNVIDQLLCANTATQATNWQTNIAGGGYSWVYTNFDTNPNNTTNVGGIASSGNGQIPSFIATNYSGVTQTAILKVIPLNAGCAGVADTMLITVLPISTVADPADQILCANKLTNTVTFTGSNPSTVYNWVNTNTTIGLSSSGVGNIESFAVQNSGTTTVTSTITVTPSLNGCIGVPMTFAIQVKPVPVMQAIADQTICVGNTTASVVFNAVPSGTTYTWNNNNTSPTMNLGLGASGSSSIIASFIGNNIDNVVHTHFISVTPRFNGCAGDSVMFAINVNPVLQVNPIFSPIHCAGETNPGVIFSGNVQGVTYFWNHDNTGIGLSTSSSSGNILPFITTAGTGGNLTQVATFNVTPVLPGCQGISSTFTITVKPIPTVDVNPQFQSVCHNQMTVPVVFTGNIQQTTYSWSQTNVSIMPANYVNPGNGIGNILSFPGQNTGLITQTSVITVIPSFNSCIGSPKEFTITVEPIPTVSNILDQTMCAGVPTTPVTFTGSLGNTANYDWVTTNTSINPANGPLTATGSGDIPSFVPVNVGWVPQIDSVICTPKFNGCSGIPRAFAITVKPIPTAVQVPNQSLCAGATTNLVSFTGNMANNAQDTTNYVWTNNNTAIGLASSGLGNIVPFVTSGTANALVNAGITVTPTINGCTGTSMNFTITTVDPIPLVDQPSSQTWCAGKPTNAVFFTGQNPTTSFIWTNSNTSIGLASSGVATMANGNGIASFTTLPPGLTSQSGTITVTPEYFGCLGSPKTFTINVKPVPNVFITPQNQMICASGTTQTIQFTGVLTGTSYDWTVDNSSINPNNWNVTPYGNGDVQAFPAVNSTPTVQTATIICTPSFNGCIGDTAMAIINVNPISSVVLPSLNYAYCQGDVVPQNCFVGNNPSTTYLWSNSNTAIGLPSSGTGCIPSFSALNSSLANDSGQIIIIPTINGCAGIPDTFMIVTKPIPNVYAVPDINICAGVTVPTITFQGDMTSTTTFNWDGNTNIGLNPNNGTNTIPSFVGVNTSQIILVDSIINRPERQGCYGARDTLLISVNPISQLTIIDSVYACNGDLVPQIVINGTSSSAIYSWSNDNTSIGLSASGISTTAPFGIPSFTATNLTPVIQYAQVIVTPLVNNCPGVKDTLNFAIKPTPTVNAVASQSLCAGTTSTPIPFSGNVANTVFNWSHNNAAVGLVPTSGIGNIPSFDGGANLYPNGDIVASVTVTPTKEGCSGLPINFTITDHALPVINAGLDTILCLGQFITPLGSGWSNAGLSFGFQWSANPSNANNTTPLNGQPYYPDATTTLSVIGTDMNLCQNMDTLLVTYLQVAAPQVFAGIDTALCFGESITLTAVHDGDLLVWDNNVLDGVEFTPVVTDSYIATASHVNGCYSKDTIVVTVNSLPIITANASDDFICDGDSTILWGDGAGIGAVYSWDNNVIDSVGFVPLTTNTYEVIGTDINGCKDTADIVVTVNPNPVVLFSSNVTFGGCLPFTPTFYDLSSPASGTCIWDFGDGNTSNQLDSAINIYDNYGCYDVTLTSTTPEGCSTSLTQQDFVCVNEIIADFEPDTFEQPISNPSFEFNNTSQNATSYQWFFGDLPPSTSTNVHPNHTYGEIGLYSVTLVASAQDGCTDTAVIVIKVRDEVIVYVPNSFTPDDNGLNDIFLPVLTAGYDRTEGWQFKIYNRWGEEIFNSEIVGNGWDGTYKGEPVQFGSYTWSLRFKDSQNNKIHDFTGHVNLIR